MTLARRWCRQESILGVLMDGDAHLCYTLERESVAIPLGTYPVVLSWSPKFKQVTPEVCNVPGRYAIRIHAGNRAEESEGCILVGDAVGDVDGDGPDNILQSQSALGAVIERLKGYLATGVVWLVVT